MADSKPQSTTSTDSQSKGFQLPTPKEGTKPPAETGVPTSTTGSQSGPPKATTQVQTGLPPGKGGTQARDISIAIGILLGCMVIFLFAKKKYSNWLVQNRKNPQAANAAGLWLFLLLSSLAAAAIFPLIRAETFFNEIFFGPVGGIALISLIFLVLKSR
jgi:hypothetical protein